MLKSTSSTVFCDNSPPPTESPLIYEYPRNNNARRFVFNSGRTLRLGLRRAELLYGVQQPAHRTVPELFSSDRRRGPLRRDHVASDRHHQPVQQRVAAEEHHQVHARQLEGGGLHTSDTPVHQRIARQQDLSASIIASLRTINIVVVDVFLSVCAVRFVFGPRNRHNSAVRNIIQKLLSIDNIMYETYNMYIHAE